jgi:UDP-N-acetylmuramate: L-alanyl-gamma-D-glutamyl-meso-diaminopimelate ligase
MATLAALLKHQGCDVQGSDENIYPPMSTFLESEQIRTFAGYDAKNITSDIDLVVVGNAISRGNAELEVVLEQKQRYCSLPEAVRDHFLWKARSIVIAGTHGKTTTTSLAGWLLVHGGADPSILVGGIARNLGDHGSSYRLGKGRDFVIEGDEYDSAFFDKSAKFLKYLPDIAVVNNIEFDHADIYADLDAIRLAFRRLVNLVPRSGLTLLGADSPDALAMKKFAQSRVESFGLAESADWRATGISVSAEGQAFTIVHAGEPLTSATLPLFGAHNVRNALAAVAVAHAVGIPANTIAAGLKAFKGVKRRLEIFGEAGGVTVYDDFAHHPTAIAETLAGLRAANPKRRLWAVFEPRSASSSRSVFQRDFARAFGPADEVIIAPVFRTNLPEAERLSPERLVDDLKAAGQHARYASSLDDIVTTIARERHQGDLVVFMSNGGFGGIHARMLQALSR